MREALEATNLSKRYRRNWALRNFSVAIPEGQVAGLVGLNGAGKTTLLHLAIGLIRPTEGLIEVLGTFPHEKLTSARDRVAFVAQDRPLYGDFTVRDMLRLGREMNSRWDQKYAESRLNRLDISLDQLVGQLSGGHHAQVALALALARRPDLLLLDEPVEGLDPVARRDFLHELVDARNSSGMTVVLSSHNIEDIASICNFLVILVSGRARLAGTLDALLSQHRAVVLRDAHDNQPGESGSTGQPDYTSIEELVLAHLDIASEESGADHCFHG